MVVTKAVRPRNLQVFLSFSQVYCFRLYPNVVINYGLMVTQNLYFVLKLKEAVLRVFLREDGVTALY